MPKPRISDRDTVKQNAGLSLTKKQLDQLSRDAKKYGFPSRSALLAAFFDQQYPAFLYTLMQKHG